MLFATPAKASRVIKNWHNSVGIACIAYQGKYPRRKNWQHETTDQQQFFTPSGEAMNIGWQLGEMSGNLCDFDLDIDDEDMLIAAVHYIEDALYPIYTGRGGNERHCFFRIANRPEYDQLSVRKAATADGEHHIEFRTGGKHENGKNKACQSLAFGTHPNGQQITFMNRRKPETAAGISVVDWNEAQEIWHGLKRLLGLKESSER